MAYKLIAKDTYRPNKPPVTWSEHETYSEAMLARANAMLTAFQTEFVIERVAD